MLFGKEGKLPIDVAYDPSDNLSRGAREELDKFWEKVTVTREVAGQNILQSQKRYKIQHDKKARERIFQVGQEVWMTNTRRKKGFNPKLCSKFLGPYYIVERKNDCYRLRDSRTQKLMKSSIHANRLKEYLDPADRPTNHQMIVNQWSSNKIIMYQTPKISKISK